MIICTKADPAKGLTEEGSLDSISRQSLKTGTGIISTMSWVQEMTSFIAIPI
jgi:hypothetical protein